MNNCVGIDVSKGKSMVAVMRPCGESIRSPFEVRHTATALHQLAEQLKGLDGETRVVMEATGHYHTPVALVLAEAGLQHVLYWPAAFPTFGLLSGLVFLHFFFCGFGQFFLKLGLDFY